MGHFCTTSRTAQPYLPPERPLQTTSPQTQPGSVDSLFIAPQLTPSFTTPEKPLEPIPFGTTSINLILPPEIIFRIIELGNSGIPYGGRLSDVYGFLQATSLVSKEGGWKENSQQLMWKRLWCGTEKRARLIVQSGAFGRYSTNWISIVSNLWYEGVTEETARKVIGGLVGLKELNINGYHELDEGGEPKTDFGMLCTPNLKDLKKLSLSFCYFKEPNTTSIVPYSLSYLDLHGFVTTADNPYTIFINPNLKTLSITPPTDVYYNKVLPENSRREDYANFFCSVAPQLTKLAFRDHISDVLPFLHLCTSLTTLEAESDVTSLRTTVGALKYPLKHLIVRPFTLSEFVPGLGEVLELEALKGLAKVSFLRDERSRVRMMRGGIEVMDELERRGVEVVCLQY